MSNMSLSISLKALGCFGRGRARYVYSPQSELFVYFNGGGAGRNSRSQRTWNQICSLDSALICCASFLHSMRLILYIIRHVRLHR